jgi:Domain of unknown function (DUF4412)
MRYIFALCVFVSSTAFAGHRIEQTTHVNAPKGAPQTPDTESTFYWHGSMMRMDNGAETTTLIDYKSDTITFINHRAKEYSQSPIAEVLKAMKATMADMKKKIQALPPEQRESMEAVFNQKGKLALKATGETKKIIGFDASRFILSQEGKDKGEVWYSKAVDLKEIAPYAKRFSEMTQGMMGTNWADVLAKTENGYPLRSLITLDVMGQQASYSTDTTKYEKMTPAPGTFSVPEAYKKVDAPRGVPGAAP